MKGGKTSFDKTSPENAHSHNSEVAVGANKSGVGVAGDGPNGSESLPLDLQEAVSLKERMARYQAAVSKRDCGSFSANATEESETCTVPGGLASVKKQFEKEEIAASQNTVSQYQYQHKSDQVSDLEKWKQTTSHLNQHVQETVIDTPEDEEIPKVSMQFLKQQFEKTAQEESLHSGKDTVTPAKQIKIESDYPDISWPPSVFSSSSSAAGASTSQRQQVLMTRQAEVRAATSAAVQANSTHCGKMEDFPSPPPDSPQTPADTTARSQSPEIPTPSGKPPVPKELYSKQRHLYELKRLYKHIHPELRKNLEKFYRSEVSEIISSQEDADSSGSAGVQQARYVFENTGSGSNPQGGSAERENLQWDEILKGEVQSMRWIFENQPLDSIKDESSDEDNGKKGIADKEIIAGGDVKFTTWMFETQPIATLGIQSSDSAERIDKIPELARGDVRTATWMFETQPLDSMNKIHQDPEGGSEETATEAITGGDVKTVRYMFENQPLDQLGQLYSVDEVNLLQLRSELKEIKGDVKRSIKHFETQPLYVIRDSLGQILEIKTVHREDVERGDVRTARWMFETQPLDMINRDSAEIKVVRGISMEESVRGGVSKAKWLFETRPLDNIKEESEDSVAEKEVIIGADVSRKCWVFETQPLDALNKTDDANVAPAEEIIGGDVKTTKHLFETFPMDVLKDSPDVGRLQKMAATEEERGDVRHQKWIFETQPLEQIGEERKEFVRTVKLEEVDRGDVRNYKHLFETSNLVKYDESQKIQVEGVSRGAVELNKSLFESTPLYAIQDSLGKYHKVKTIQQEEILRGDVRSCRWLFETRPIDQFDESIQKFQIIKGISAQEIQAGDVKSAKWLFETQPLDAIKYFSNVENEKSASQQTTDVVRGDVKTCRWLFETQPMESLYEKVELMTDKEEIHKGDVKTCTWLFETQPLDAIREDSEATGKQHTVKPEDIQGSDVRTACFLFETESLDNIQGEEGKEVKTVELDIQAGDVSGMKYKFENQSLDSISSGSEEVLKKIKTLQAEDIQKGNVLNCRWLFENRPIDTIKENQECNELFKMVTDIQGGDVRRGCFIFETFSLDQIKEESSEISSKKTVNEEEITKGDVRNYKMLFETQPLYAIQDKDGYYHEVTTVKKEEVIHGDVRGTRWLFETKPLESINESDHVYLIKSVTQEDILKGDVSSVRYRFETQPLDKISEDEKTIIPTVDCVQGGDVKAGKQLFESEEFDKRTCLRTVSISEIQKGNVKTSTWLFETRTMDELRGDGSEFEYMKTVTKEDFQKGDVQQAVWLFENQPLDSIKETDDSITKNVREEIPSCDVKTTTWLFETTPFHEFNEKTVEKVEIIGKSIKETLEELHSHKVVESHGIIIEADEVGDVRMAKYKLMNPEPPEIQKEEIIRGDLRNIMINLLSKRDSSKREILVGEGEKGNISLTKSQLLNKSTDVHIEKEEVVKGDIQQAIKNLFSDKRPVKQGILIQEDERGDINMTVYSLLHKNNGHKIEHEEVIGGDVKHTIHNLLLSTSNNGISERAKIDETERGNVQFFTTCIEAGALDYLKLLQTGSNETLIAGKQDREEEIIRGDVEGTKLLLKKRPFQIERTVNETDIIPGDVQNTVKIFMTEPQGTSCQAPKEEIIKGDLKATLNSFSQAINQTEVSQKEGIMKADIPVSLKSLKEPHERWQETQKPDVIPGDIEQAIESLEKAITTRTEILKKEVIRDDLEAALRSLNEVQRSLKEVAPGAATPEKSSEDLKMAQVSEAVQRGPKGIALRPVPDTREQAAQLHSGLGAHKQITVQPLQDSHSEKCAKGTIPREAPKGTVKIVVGREHNNDALEKSLRRLSESPHKFLENFAELGGSTVLRGDAGRKGTGGKNEQGNHTPIAIGSGKKSVRIGKSETEDRVLKAADASTATLTVDQGAGKPQGPSGMLGSGPRDKETSHTQSQKKKEKGIKVSTSGQNSKSSLAPQPTNVAGNGTGREPDYCQELRLQQELRHAQSYSKVSEKKEINLPPGQPFNPLPAVDDMQNVSKLKVTEESYHKLNATGERQKTDVQPCSKNLKARTDVTSTLTVAEEKSSTSIKSAKGNDGPERDSPLPPPSPPSPPPSNASSEIEFPLPPPPPPMTLSDNQMFPSLPSTEKANVDFESFPPPPPPIDDRSERRCPSGSLPLPPPPPPLLQPASLLPGESGRVRQNSETSTPAVKPPKKFPKPKHFKPPQENPVDASPKLESTALNPNSEAEMTQMEEKNEKRVTGLVEPTQVKKGKRVINPVEGTGQSSDSEAHQGLPSSKKPHPFPADSANASPKPYVRKFKTPLMIAEENYRLQKEESGKRKEQSSCQEDVKAKNLSQAEAESERPRKENRPLEPSSLVTTAQSDSEYQFSIQASGPSDDKQLSASTTVSSATGKLQNVLEISTAEDQIQKEVLQGSRNLSQPSLAYQMEQIHQKFTTHEREQKIDAESLPMSKNKTNAPSFKVKTVNLPTADQSSKRALQDFETHKKYLWSNAQNRALHEYPKSQEKELGMAIRRKQTAAEEHCHSPNGEERLTDKTPSKPRRNTQGENRNVIRGQEQERTKSKDEKVSVTQENQGKTSLAPNEEREVVQRKQKHLKNKSTEKVVKQKVTDMHLDSQAQSFQQTQINTSESTDKPKTLSQQHISVQDGEYLRVRGTEKKQVFFNTKDSKQEITQNKPLFPTLKGSQQEDEKYTVNILEFLRKREELQQILSRVKQFEVEPNTNNIKTFQTFLNIIPGWLIDEEFIAHVAKENNLEKMKEEIIHIKAEAEEMLLSCENMIKTAMMSTQAVKLRSESANHSRASQKISNVSISSKKKVREKESKVEKASQQEVKPRREVKRMECTVSSPLLKKRSPSPTYITIESTARREETPVKDSSVRGESAPIPLPVKPTSRVHRASTSPSPPSNRAEQLAKLKDTTAKLAQGTAQHQSIPPGPIVEKRSEIIQSPATLRRQIKIELRGRESLPKTSIPISVSHVTPDSDRDAKEAQEEVKKVEKRKTCVRHDLGNIPGSIVPEAEGYDAVEIIRKVEVPKVGLSGPTHRYEASNQTVHMAESIVNGHEGMLNTWIREFEDMPGLGAKSNGRVFANGEINHNVRQEERCTFSKEEIGSSSLDNESLNSSFRNFSCSQPREPLERSPCETPVVCSETRSLRKCFSGVDAFDSKVVGSRTAASSSQSPEGVKSGFDFKHAPPTYEDVISGHILDISAADSPEDLLRNFQKTWQESERVFQNLGYAISEASETEMRSTYHEEAAFKSETSTSGQGSMRTLSKDSLSNGISSSRQADFP
ncbi:xin actin-binding repeat-containing protein 2 [Tachyglossus aculeatus]|uniref:xin actin-binding repeat-containing protein 2 n=1 Tax=Tachyglossus aculeatus TaxID=9261 RepID=UPI0018F6531F|nr:xin actin-binding repeat-containing protein 2 [Tachyglossus aculeatus]